MTALHPQTRAVIDAVLEALDIPHAATAAHDETRAKILDERITDVKVSLRLIAEADDRGDRFLSERVTSGLEYLREKLAENPPVGYVTDKQAREQREAGATWAEAVRLPAEVA